MRSLANVICLLVGALYVFSGFVKAVDPEGFAYKLTEYYLLDEFRFFGTELLISTSKIQSVLICAFEIFLGFVLLVRYNLRLWAIPNILMIIFFTFLTGYSWGFDVVKECGCFGNAIPLTSGQSFVKDLVLIVLTGFIYSQRKNILPVFEYDKYGQWFSMFGGILSVLISVYGLMHLPMVDFRAYHEGANINEGINDGEPAVIEYFYLMSKGAEEKLIPAVEYGDYSAQGWEMKSYEEKIIKAEKKPSIEDFALSNDDGDFTQDILTKEEYYLFMISKHIEDADEEGLQKIYDLRYEQTGIVTFALTASGENEILETESATQTDFNFYTCDEKALATFIRSNPGLVLMKGDHIIKKWHHNDVPSQEELKEILK